ncbi:hypothetical protein U9M48_009796 [Paspalum notatum var. saurae]|uniref:Aminotransferase-like plant mobile domain-containing protein n=1 Tax=Paspalum notatum var. saurae TaxID=547442 RepID=A0AAQ3SS85_PASNO
MAECEEEEPLVQESTVPVVSAADPSRRSVRLARTLLPGAQHGAAHLPALPTLPRDPGPVLAPADFRGWPACPLLWKPWRELGILDAILTTTYRVRRDEGALLQLAAFWSAATNTFSFPWGEATVTLQDVAALAGLPLVGDPVRAPVSESDDLEKEVVGALTAVRSALHKSKKKRAFYGAWAKHFLEERTPDDGGGGGELVEHGAFLSLWLSSFVLPSPPFDVVRPETFPIAARLARGQAVALAPAALASIYNDLSAIKRRLGSRDKEEPPFMVSAPMHILQVWLWERFPQLRPEKTNTAAAPDDVPGGGVPRVARWHDVCTALDTRYVHKVLVSPESFEWLPYGSTSSFDLKPETCGGCWVRGHDIARSRELLSYARCLHPCELVGMNCIEMYRPHRVARQLGFDQDVPGNVVRVNSTWEKAWDTYNIEAKNLSFIVPNHEPGVTVKYAQWWKPYSSACDTALANAPAARMKRLRHLGSPVKTKMEGLPDANSCKELHMDTAIRVPQPTQDAAEDTQDERMRLPLWRCPIAPSCMSSVPWNVWRNVLSMS